MEEKKLTDEEIVKALECCANGGSQKDCELCPIGIIKCFEQENLMPQLALDLINRQKAEIERLTEKTKSQLVLNQTIQTLNEKILAENAELQQQVADLKERAKIDLENEKNWGKIQTKQAVKDTAKGILQTIKRAKENGQIHYNEAFMITAQKAYGVEVE